MTFWDLVNKFFEKGGIAWILLLAALAGMCWLIAHPDVVKGWNVNITMWVAGFVPKKRKRAFERKLNWTIDSAKKRFSESSPPFMRKFLPYDLKVQWVDGNDSIESIIDNKQIVVYVPSYKNEVQQAVGVLHNYCTTGFAEKAKLYMPTDAKKASDVIITQKLAQHAGHNVYDYFNREYLPELLKKDKSYAIIFDKLQKIDRDGLFIPILLNEIDKYANRIHPAPASPVIMDTIIHLMNFIYKIVSRDAGEIVPLTFSEGGIRIRIILAISDALYDTEKPIEDTDELIQSRSVDTIYVLATGFKMGNAREIAEGIYNRNPMDLYEPIETNYKRYTRRPDGKDSICFEINLR